MGVCVCKCESEEERRGNTASSRCYKKNAFSFCFRLSLSVSFPLSTSFRWSILLSMQNAFSAERSERLQCSWKYNLIFKIPNTCRLLCVCVSVSACACVCVLLYIHFSSVYTCGLYFCVWMVVIWWISIVCTHMCDWKNILTTKRSRALRLDSFLSEVQSALESFPLKLLKGTTSDQSRRSERNEAAF